MKYKLFFIMSSVVITGIINSIASKEWNRLDSTNRKIDPVKIFVVIGNTLAGEMRYYPQITGITMIPWIQGLDHSLLEQSLNSSAIPDWYSIIRTNNYSYFIYKLDEAQQDDSKVFTRIRQSSDADNSTLSIPNTAFQRSNLRNLDSISANAVVKYVLVCSLKKEINTMPQQIIFYYMDDDENKQLKQLGDLSRAIDENGVKLPATPRTRDRE